jgi:4-diphosphocytidyl-2-C-methyl-D-erythritol kinase
VILRAAAKLNLCLYLGRLRDDGLHELRSLFCPLVLSDRIEITEAEADEVLCPGVRGPNLVTATLDALRARGWESPPLRIEIEKQIPVAAGLGGGSADAAALLRLARDQVDGLDELALALGADVPSQLDPSFALVGGAGELVEPLPDPGEFALVLIPAEEGLSTAAVYAEADRLGIARGPGELEEVATALREAAGGGRSPLAYGELLVNDLQHAALSLRPELREALDALEERGAATALLTGSGPTAFGLFADIAAADRAAAALSPRFADAIVTTPPTLAG